VRRFIVLFVLLLVACGAPGTVQQPTAVPASPAAAPTTVAAADPCSVQDLQAYRAVYNEVVGRWNTALIQAGQTPPASLQGPIDHLQSIADEFAKLNPPPCARPPHDETAQSMQQTIGGYKNLMAQQAVGATLRDAIDQLLRAQIEIAALPGTPVPTATTAPTLTPLPTFTPLPTLTPTNTPTPTATPQPRPGVISSRQTQVFETATSTVPIRTLFRGTQVQVFELQKGRLHIHVGKLDGWVSQGAVQLR
jgi:hypothetical protein